MVITSLAIAGIFLAGSAAATIVWFFLWRNNKEKFSNVVTTVDDFVGKYNSKAELEAALTDLINKVKK